MGVKPNSLSISFRHAILLFLSTACAPMTQRPPQSVSKAFQRDNDRWISIFHFSKLKGRYTRGILLPEHASGARSGSKAPRCVPTISWLYFILGSRISTPQNAPRYLTGLNIWEQAPGANWANWKRSLVCTDTCKVSLEHDPGAKPLVCIGLKSDIIFIGWGWVWSEELCR